MVLPLGFNVNRRRGRSHDTSAGEYFSNERHALWPGQFVDARLHLSTRKGGIVVSEAAVQRGPEGTHVFVIALDNTVTMRVIKVALLPVLHCTIHNLNGRKQGYH